MHLAHGRFATDWGHPKDKENIVQIAKTVGIYLSSCFWTSIQSLMTCHQFQDAKDIHLPCSASDFSASFRHQVYVEFASGNVINVAWQQKMNGKIQLMEFKGKSFYASRMFQRQTFPD